MIIIVALNAVFRWLTFTKKVSYGACSTGCKSLNTKTKQTRNRGKKHDRRNSINFFGNNRRIFFLRYHQIIQERLKLIPLEKQPVFRKIMQELTLVVTGKVPAYFQPLAADLLKKNEEEIFRWLKRNQNLIMNL